MNRLKFTLGSSIDHELLDRVESIFDSENLIEVILHAHLLIERAITTKIANKLQRPEILFKRQWSFSQKVYLYLGLYNPGTWEESILLGFNRLRNSIAHDFSNESQLVVNHLPWDGEAQAPDALAHVKAVAMMLLFHLGALRGVKLSDQAIAEIERASSSK